MPSPQQADTAVLTAQTQLARLATQTDRYTAEAWVGLGSWREADIERFADQVGPMIRSVETTTDLVSAAKITTTLGTGLTVPTAGESVTANPDWWRDPFITVWSGLAHEMPLAEAVNAGHARLTKNTRTLITERARDASIDTMTQTGIARYARIPAGGETCGYCVAAATRTYRTDGPPMPLHPACDCDTRLILPGENPDTITGPWMDLYDRLDLSDTSRDALGAQRITPA